ncbi:hypothetical protein E1287_36705 [Actinomadura sp. KC06]|uniref:hypothetical protein n=1 Tax=Actinomadura sp. KC06 TaxID=2530369 RepID=UPI0010511E57|nr:hypothetical protein [Actinomadura sp. KC06]TDD26079.1 hypothetical protein E1287_36705 [Actinomadura sp. KC06]
MYSTHEMRMVRIEESGLEEWACPTCGRRMLLRWPPHYEKRIVEPGDERAGHVGSSADTPADPQADTPAGMPAAPQNGGQNGGQNGAADDTPPQQRVSERQWRNARRWLRETGVDATPAPAARTRLDPSEPV